MRLINNSKCNLSHDKYVLGIGKTLDVPEAIANIWLKIDGVNRFISPEDMEKEKEQAVKKAVEEAIKAEKDKAASKPKTTTKKRSK